MSVTINPTVPAAQIERQLHFTEAVHELLKRLYPSEKLHYFIQTFGCQQNEADSEVIAGLLNKCGYLPASESGNADIIVINTCAIREHAELKALSITGQYKHLKAKKPSLKIVMCGCLASLTSRGSDIRSRYPYVDFIFGTTQLWRLPEFLYDSLMSGKRKVISDSEVHMLAEGLPSLRKSSFRAWLTIMSGCNNFCSYCVVPYVRGRERSRDSKLIMSEARKLAEKGYREITLLGQNVNSYAGAADGSSFPELLDNICKIDSDFIIRFMTSHPKDANKRLFDVMAANPRAAKQLHLPVQSGSSRVLADMNRGYTRECYTELIEYARSVMPKLSVSTDIIVGFPGETEDDFEQTLSLLREVRYDSIFSFIYSPRPGTSAANFGGQIPKEVKTERFARLLDVQNAISLDKNRALVGCRLKVLVEGYSKNNDSYLTGRTEGGRLVHFRGGDSIIGSFVSLNITEAEPFNLIGEL